MPCAPVSQHMKSLRRSTKGKRGPALNGKDRTTQQEAFLPFGQLQPLPSHPTQPSLCLHLREAVLTYISLELHFTV